MSWDRNPITQITKRHLGGPMHIYLQKNWEFSKEMECLSHKYLYFCKFLWRIIINCVIWGKTILKSSVIFHTNGMVGVVKFSGINLSFINHTYLYTMYTIKLSKYTILLKNYLHLIC